MNRCRPTLLGPVALLACTLPNPEVADPRPPPSEPPPVVDSGPPEPPDEPPAPREPPRVLTDPGSGIAVVWAGAGVGAAVAGAELIVLEPDGRHLDAIDWRSGEAQWRVELPTTGVGRLYGLDDRVLLHEGDRAVVIEAARGRVLGQHDAPADAEWPHGHTVVHRKDACAWVGGCGIQPFDCSNGAPRGAYLASTEAHLYGISDDPTEHDTACEPTPALLGRSGTTVVLVAAAPRTDDTGRPAGSVPALVGLEANGDALVWQQPLPGASTPAGMTDDGACWMLDLDLPRLRVFDCETGTPRWERPLGPGRLEVHAMADAIVVARQHGGRWRVSAYATSDGNPRWSTRLARRQLPVLPGQLIPSAHVTGTRRVYALLDAERGGIAGELVAGRDEELWRDPSGGFVLIGRELRELDEQGHLTRQRPYSGARVHALTTDHLLGLEDDAIEIYDRDQLRERARLEGRLWLETTAGLPDDRLLLRRHGDDGVVVLLELGEGGRR